LLISASFMGPILTIGRFIRWFNLRTRQEAAGSSICLELADFGHGWVRVAGALGAGHCGVLLQLVPLRGGRS
ncbi:MAG: hypothetical protein RL091_148, partial [Verrucomicrobiota bacterium]